MAFNPFTKKVFKRESQCFTPYAMSFLDGVTSDIALKWTQFKRITFDDINAAPK